jgi:hypothetical protein
VRKVNGEEEKSGRQHPEAEDRQEPEKPADCQQDRKRKAHRQPMTPTQTAQWPAQRRDQAFQGMELPMKPALAP